MDWLKTHAPHDVAQVIIHNDWRLDNVILSKEAEVIGVLDWEMATIGDPLMELGSALAYWVEADDGYFMKMTQRQPSFLPGMLKRQEIVDYYLQQSGLQPQAWAFYEVFGLFRLAGIIQQIYYRYFHGQTNNPAFKKMWMLVNYFDWRCKALIRHSGKR
jgi:aminoglycoside phosphotransferase (APT) family kinase protein